MKCRFLCGPKFVAPLNQYQGVWLLTHVVTAPWLLWEISKGLPKSLCIHWEQIRVSVVSLPYQLWLSGFLVLFCFLVNVWLLFWRMPWGWGWGTLTLNDEMYFFPNDFDNYSLIFMLILLSEFFLVFKLSSW